MATIWEDREPAPRPQPPGGEKASTPSVVALDGSAPRPAEASIFNEKLQPVAPVPNDGLNRPAPWRSAVTGLTVTGHAGENSSDRR